MLKSRKTGKCVGTVRFALNRKTSVKGVKREHLNRGGRVHAFREKSRKTDKKVRHARTRSADKFRAPTVLNSPFSPLFFK